MARSCEVCAHLAEQPRKPRKPPPRLRRLAVEGRIVALCDTHATAVTGANAKSLEVLRELFREADGKRSLVDRRSPLDRRLFPPRPEGRRRSTGRRDDDSAL
ncbi:MAG TPA: hypothetical protein VHU80_16480 [Polyangiaceae bacterium]|jgi:hypothetical protein|nr:hypothetical protein [Polyangiaceae bacterium]